MSHCLKNAKGGAENTGWTPDLKVDLPMQINPDHLSIHITQTNYGLGIGQNTINTENLIQSPQHGSSPKFLGDTPIFGLVFASVAGDLGCTQHFCQARSVRIRQEIR